MAWRDVPYLHVSTVSTGPQTDVTDPVLRGHQVCDVGLIPTKLSMLPNCCCEFSEREICSWGTEADRLKHLSGGVSDTNRVTSLEEILCRGPWTGSRNS